MKRGWAWLTARGWLGFGCALLMVLVVLAGASPLAAQKEKKRKDREQKQGDASDTTVRLPDPQAIEVAISEMLGAWQIGDVERLHKYYADDVTVVSGAWEPPLVGWANYVHAYQSQRERMSAGRLDRSNTYVNAKGNYAWATYQWDFSATVDGSPTSVLGHTTLVLEKRGDRWLIVHNHTSLVPEMKAPQPAAQPGTPKPNPPQGGPDA